MRLRAVAAIALLSIVAPLPAAEQADVLLYLPLDGSAQPRIAAEGTEVTVLGPEQYAEGRIGRALVAGDGAAQLELPAEGNVLAERGTVEMWVCPLDWRGDDSKFHEFFATTRRGWILLYKYLTPGTLLFLVADDRAQSSWTTVSANIREWEPGQWHHIAATWRPGELAVYVDGEQTASARDAPLSPDLGPVIGIGDRPWHIERDARTLIDEVTVYRRALAAAEIEAAYRRATPLAPSDRPLVMLGSGGERPTLDGHMYQDEWNRACAVTGFADNITAEIARRHTWAYLSRDDDALYVAFLSELPEGGLVDTVREPDGPVWHDDAVEVFIDRSAGEERNAYHHLIVNPSGVCYTSHGKDNPTGWDPDLRVASDVPADVWMVEIAIPWRDLGGPPEDGETWGLNLCRDWQNPVQWASWAHVSSFHDQSGYGRLVFADAPFVQVVSLGRLERGRLSLVGHSRGAAARGTVRVLRRGKEVLSRHMPLAPEAGEVALLDAEADLEESGAYRLEIEVRRQADDALCWWLTAPFTYFPALRLSSTPRPDLGVWRITADASGWRGPHEDLSVRLQCTDPAGDVVWEGALSEFEGDRATAEMPERDLGAGEYRIAGVLVADGEEVAEAEAAQIKPDVAPWWGNDLYEELEVLPPWTPVRVDGTAIETWGRSYRWEGPLPAQMTSQGERMLSRPIALVVSTEDGAVAWRDATAAVVEQGDASATIEGRAEAERVELHTRCTTEFDGMTRVELQLVPRGEADLQSVRLEVPMRPEIATLHHFYGPWAANVSGAVQEGEGEVWASERFLPYYWLGDEERGLMWFCESEEGWVAGERPPLRVERRDGEVVLVIEPIAAPATLEEPWRWTFGLHATPVKPLPERWRSLRMQGEGGRISIMWSAPSLLKYFGYAEPADPEDFARRVDGLREAGQLAVPYSNLRMLSEQSPEWRYFGAVWAVPGRADRSSSDVNAFGAPFMAVCPAAEGWADFVVWKNKQYVETYRLGGLYHDHSVPVPCDNPLHGCGWEDAEGGRHRRFPIFAARDLYRRIYAMLKDQPHETFMMGHMSGRLMIPMLSFCDAYLDGEHFRSRLVDDYTELLPPEAFRAEFMGKQWGVIPYLLPEFPEEVRGDRAPTRHLMSLTVLHDTPVWPSWSNREVIFEVREALDEFGYVDAQFLGYWDNEAWLRRGQEGVKVSAYRRDERALLIVSNLSAQPQEVTLQVEPAALGVPGASATNAETGDPVPMQDGTLTVSIPARDLALVTLE